MTTTHLGLALATLMVLGVVALMARQQAIGPLMTGILTVVILLCAAVLGFS